MMTTKVSLKCKCGSFRGIAREVSPSTGSRIICLCDDCQTYAHFLGREQDILDPNGGTEIFQLTPSQLSITDGEPHLRCVRLSPKGLMRWYAGCCNTPFANTLPSAKVPFAGVPILMMERFGDSKAGGESLGPIRGRVHGRYGLGELPAGTHQRGPLGLILRTLRILSIAWIRGRHAPTPFFDAKTGAPVVEPLILSKEERTKFRNQVGKD